MAWMHLQPLTALHCFDLIMALASLMVDDPSSCSSVASSLARVSAVFSPEGIHCKTAVSAWQIKIVQESCEGGGGHPGLPVPKSRHGLCRHKATLNTGHSFFNFLFAFCSGESLQGRQDSGKRRPHCWE